MTSACLLPPGPDGRLPPAPPWQHDAPVPLLPHVQRLTAPNPGVMTGPGTNSYLVGTVDTGFVVIDPGPDDDGHVQRLWRACAGDVRAIVCTHSHADHSPAARPLQALCADAPCGPPPVLGLPSAATASASSFFRPDRALSDGERLCLSGADAQPRYSLRVLHTPGHAANHLCLLLEQDGLLFSGDHVLGGTSTLVSLPDGDMSDYLQSLDALHAVCAAHGRARILPAHGPVLADACGEIARLKAHRLAREAKVLAAMQARPDGNAQDWVPLAYDDVPPATWPLAERSLMAHVQRLRALGLAPKAAAGA